MRFIAKRAAYAQVVQRADHRCPKNSSVPTTASTPYPITTPWTSTGSSGRSRQQSSKNGQHTADDGGWLNIAGRFFPVVQNPKVKTWVNASSAPYMRNAPELLISETLFANTTSDLAASRLADRSRVSVASMTRGGVMAPRYHVATERERHTTSKSKSTSSNTRPGTAPLNCHEIQKRGKQ